MKNKIIFSVVVLSIVGWLAWKEISSPDIRYIQGLEVFDQFEYKVELTEKLNTYSLDKKTRLDSLEIDLRNYQYKLDTAVQLTENQKYSLFEAKRTYFYAEKERLDENERLYIQDADQKILTRMNAYVVDFAEEEGIDLLLSSTNDGSIMYGNEALSLTKECIEFINKKYRGESE